MKASLAVLCQWTEQLRQLLPDLHGHRVKALAFFVFGLVSAGVVRLPRVAEEWLSVSQAKTPSIERRLARFLANEQIAVSPLWCRLLGCLMRPFAGQRLLFVLDTTPLDDRACVVYLGLLVHSRLLPVGWRVMPLHETWQTDQWTIVGILLDQIMSVLGHAECTLIADRGLARPGLVRLCQARGWHYLLRLQHESYCMPKRGPCVGRWGSLARLVAAPGQSWVGRAHVWQRHPCSTWLSAVWEPGTKAPWFLISDQSAGRARVQTYARRMRVEATFLDFKSRGWDIEGTVLTNPARLERLLLVLFLTVWWVSHLAAGCIHRGARERFDRHDRRDKSIFRLGRLWLRHLLEETTQRAWCLPFHRTKDGWAFSLRF